MKASERRNDEYAPRWEMPVEVGISEIPIHVVGHPLDAHPSGNSYLVCSKASKPQATHGKRHNRVEGWILVLLTYYRKYSGS